jgi:hypothetical protein
VRVPLVLNELSAGSPVSGSPMRWSPVSDSIRQGRQRMSETLDAIRVAGKRGMGTEVYGLGHAALYMMVAPDYPVAQWRNDHLVDLDERMRFGVYATKDPCTPENVRVGNYEVNCSSLAGDGLRLAYLLKLMTISICSGGLWDSSKLPVTVVQLSDEGMVSEVHDEIPNACRSAHVELNAIWIKERLRDMLPATVTDLEAWAPNRLLHLVFCGDWMENLRKSRDMTRMVASELATLEQYIVEHGREPFDNPQHPYPHDTSVESRATLQQYAMDRTFRTPDGEAIVFSQHLKLCKGWRIHIYPAPTQQSCYVGYAGPHLPTVNDPS